MTTKTKPRRPQRLALKVCPEYLQRVHGLHYTLNTLRRYHVQGHGPKFHHVGGRLYIWPRDLDAWVKVISRDRAVAPLPEDLRRLLAGWRKQGVRWRIVPWVRPSDGSVWFVPEIIPK